MAKESYVYEKRPEKETYISVWNVIGDLLQNLESSSAVKETHVYKKWL